MITGSVVGALEGFPSETWTSLISGCALQGAWRRTEEHPTSPSNAGKPESAGGAGKEQRAVKKGGDSTERS